jgi:hypothetical protein
VISENDIQLVEVSPDLPAATVKVPGLPSDAASAVGKSTINDRSPSGRIHGSEGQKTRLAQYFRKVDAALRPVLAGSDIPLIIAATKPVESQFRSVSGLQVLPEAMIGAHDRTPDAEIARAARPILDSYYQAQLDGLRKRFEQSAGANRATTDIADAARAATFGNIDILLIDIEETIPGMVDDETGVVTFGAADAVSYGVVDEIARRASQTGARVLGVRKADLPDGKPLAAILRSTL